MIYLILYLVGGIIALAINAFLKKTHKDHPDPSIVFFLWPAFLLLLIVCGFLFVLSYTVNGLASKIQGLFENLFDREK